jgi:hypothetical protein
MKLPSYARIISEEIPSEPRKWIGKLIDPLNSFMLSIKNGLNKGLTINDNMSGALKTVTVTNNTVAFSYETNQNPKAVIIGGWSDLTNSAWVPTTYTYTDTVPDPDVVVVVTSGISLKWSYADSVITCTFYGLDSSHKYNVNLVIFND